MTEEILLIHRELGYIYNVIWWVAFWLFVICVKFLNVEFTDKDEK